MIYIIGFIVGILNGLFSSGAGQVLVFYLVFIKKLETHKVRALSVALLSVASIIAIFGYFNIAQFEIKNIIVLLIIASVTGVIGTKIMKKIPADILNLISGVLILVLTIIKMIKG